MYGKFYGNYMVKMGNFFYYAVQMSTAQVMGIPISILDNKFTPCCNIGWKFKCNAV